MTQSPQPLTVRTFLLGGTHDDVQTIARVLSEHDAVNTWGPSLARLSQAARGAIGTQVGSAVTGLLGIDLGNVVLGGWRKHRELLAAAKATAASPAEIRTIDLWRPHRITATYAPTVEVLVDTVPLHTVVINVTLVLEIICATLVLRAGRLVEVRAGTAQVSAGLTVDRFPVAERSHPLELPGVLHFGRGIALLPSATDAQLQRRASGAPTSSSVGPRWPGTSP